MLENNLLTETDWHPSLTFTWLFDQAETDWQPSYVESIDGEIYELIRASSDHRLQEVKSRKNDLSSLIENARSFTVDITNGVKESITGKGFIDWYLEWFFEIPCKLLVPPGLIYLIYLLFLLICLNICNGFIRWH